jgi:hypothetical protein
MRQVPRALGYTCDGTALLLRYSMLAPTTIASSITPLAAVDSGARVGR